MGERLQAGLKLKRIVFRILRAARVHLGQNRTAYFEPAVEDYRRYWEGAAQILSAEFVPLADALWEVRLNGRRDRKSTRLNSSHLVISYAVFCLKKKKTFQ